MSWHPTIFKRPCVRLIPVQGLDTDPTVIVDRWMRRVGSDVSSAVGGAASDVSSAVGGAASAAGSFVNQATDVGSEYT